MNQERAKAIEYSPDELSERMQAPLEEKRKRAREALILEQIKQKEAEEKFESDLKFMDNILNERNQDVIDKEDEEFESDDEFMEYILGEKRKKR